MAGLQVVLECTHVVYNLNTIKIVSATVVNTMSMSDTILNILDTITIAMIKYHHTGRALNFRTQRHLAKTLYQSGSK
jgi:hypothetical protein